jgi:hypothetical protein
MAKIVAVHGIGQQFSGDAIIHREWWPALVSGLHLAGRDLEDPKELDCAFYGHLFRKSGSLALSDSYRAEDVGPEEAELLKLLWQAAADTEPQTVPSPSSYAGGETLARTPKIIQRALSAVSRSSFWVNLAQAALIGDLKQVVLYMNDLDVREMVLEVVAEKITWDTRVVIGHSLGSVVAYEALCHKPQNVVSFVSLGSPLGIQNLIFQKLHPAPSPENIGAWPGVVKHWTNIADKGDIVALEKKLAPFFGKEVRDILVYNGSDAHHGERYLTTKEAGEAIAAGLWEARSSSP